MPEIKRIGVVGCGQMGAGIAQVAAQQGYEVVAREVNQELLDKGLGRIERFLSRAVEKGRLEASEKEVIQGRLSGTTELEGLAGCDIVIEAIIEQQAIKEQTFKALDGICPPETIFASNTSSISITAMAAATSRPDRFMGMHFFNPVPIMKLVELIRPLQVSDMTFQAVRDLAVALRENVIESKDRPGFIVNLMLIPFLFDAIRALESGLATARDIDTGMKIGCNHPMGPLELADFVGLDTTMFIGEVLYREFGDPKYATPPLLRRMVDAGWYGRKSGKGFYEYGG